MSEICHPAFADPPATSILGIPTSHLKLSNPDVSYGLSYPEACAKHVESLGCCRIYIICSGTLARTSDSLERLIAGIGRSKVAGVRKGMTPHTLWSEIIEVTKEARSVQTDCLVTLGAGSLSDGAKIVALALANDIATIKELAMYSVESKDPPDVVQEPTVPLICIPTSLSGGEYFSLAGGTDDATHHKQAFLHSGMGAKIIILDPELCLTTPPYHWLSTGVRAVDHCVEAICSLQATTSSDESAEKGLRVLVPNLLRCKADEACTDTEARRNCQLAVRFAMNSVRAGVPMGGSHAIGHQLGPLGVPHGVTSCIMLPAVMKYNLQHASGDYAIEIMRRQTKVKQILWSDLVVADTLKKRGIYEDTSDAGDAIDAIVRELGLPRSLSEMKVEADLDALAERALADFWSPTNPVPLLEKKQTLDILRNVA